MEDNHSTSRYYPIYRNFCYNIQVHRISSEGVLTPEAAANSSGIEDISADISMRHLADISNGTTRLVVEPFMTRTYSGPAEDGYYELYARFFNNVNSDQPNLSTVAVRVELEPMTDGSDDILILYDGNGNPVPKGGFFFPEAGTLGGVEGIRLIRFNTKDPGDITKMQKIKITGHKPGNHQDLRLYREVEITLQKKQTMTVTCTDPLPSGVNVSQTVGISIPAGLPMSMFPLEFMLEPEYLTLTPDNSKSVNMPVVSGRSIATMESTYKSKPAFQFLRTLTWEEYSALPEEEGLCTFYCYFKPNRAVSATTIWVYNEYFHKAYTSFENELVYGDYFYVHAIESCTVTMDMGTGISYKIDDGDWVSYPNKSAVNLLPDQKMYISAGSAASPKKVWNGGKFSCRNGKFKIGGNIASLLVGDDYVEAGVDIIGFSMTDMFKNHQKLIDAYDLILPMMACPASGYKSMFDGCTGLVRGPQSLPATTLGNTCYRNMFYNCSSLEYAPDMPAKAFAQGAYQRMFWHCAKLSHVKMMGTTWRKDVFFDGTTGWCDGVAATGEIWLDASLQDASNWATTWGTIVPAGWTVKYVGIDDIEP